MPNSPKDKASSTHLLPSLTLVVLAVAAVAITAIFFRPGGFSIEGEAQGATIKLNFSDSRVDLSEVLGQLFRKTETGTDADRELVASILRGHGFYRIPSRDAATALRDIKEAEDTREFMQSVRKALYNLEGPFSRPATFMEADDRVLDAIEDLYQQKPANPLVNKLWEMSLDMKGIFELRDIAISIEEDKNLATGMAASCAGNIWLGRNGIIKMNDSGAAIGLRIGVLKPCNTSRVWLSPTDMTNLIGEQTIGRGQQLQAILTPLPVNLSPEVPGK
jgi:hypothetical protein